MTDRIRAELGVYLQSDVERILRGIFAANETMFKLRPNDWEMTAFSAGFLAALRSVAISFGIENLNGEENR